MFGNTQAQPVPETLAGQEVERNLREIVRIGQHLEQIKTEYAEYQCLNFDIEKMRVRHEEWTVAMDAEKVALEDMKVEAAKIRTEIAALSGKRTRDEAEAKKAFDEAQDDIDAAKNERDLTRRGLENEKTVLVASISALKTEESDLRASIVTLRVTETRQMARLADLSSAIEAKEAIDRKLNDRLARAESIERSIVALESRFNEVSERVAGEERRLNDLTSKSEKLERKIENDTKALEERVHAEDVRLAAREGGISIREAALEGFVKRVRRWRAEMEMESGKHLPELEV